VVKCRQGAMSWTGCLRLDVVRLGSFMVFSGHGCHCHCCEDVNDASTLAGFCWVRRWSANRFLPGTHGSQGPRPSRSGHTVAIVRAEVARYFEGAAYSRAMQTPHKHSRLEAHHVLHGRSAVLDRDAAQFDRGVCSTLYNPTRIFLSGSAPCSN
jgi:hypothetical protein